MRVGICWQGSKDHKNDRNRSLPQGALAPLARMPGIQWVSMCKDGWTQELAHRGLTNGLIESKDFADTADVLTTLDLLISVDTAIAHLAGAMGREVWLLLAAVPDMRWGIGSATTPWYKSMRIFRQTVGGDWSGVMRDVVQALEERTAQQEAA